jgi:hypothetical protein
MTVEAGVRGAADAGAGWAGAFYGARAGAWACAKMPIGKVAKGASLVCAGVVGVMGAWLGEKAVDNALDEAFNHPIMNAGGCSDFNSNTGENGTYQDGRFTGCGAYNAHWAVENSGRGGDLFGPGDKSLAFTAYCDANARVGLVPRVCDAAAGM